MSPTRHFSRPLLLAGVLVLLLWVSGYAAPLKAGEYNIRSWGVDDGMAQSSVTDMVQTQDGYVWIGTLLSGLSRFDGMRFVNFDVGNTPGLTHSGIRRLLVDSSGTLWVNDYANHLIQKTGNGFQSVGAPEVKLGSLLWDRDGKLTFATLDGELLLGQYHGGTNWTWALIKSPYPGTPYFVAEAADVLWFRAPGSKLGRYANNKFELIENPSGLEARQILTLAKDSLGTIMVGTDDGLFCCTGNSFTNATPPGLKERLTVRQIISAKPGEFWVEANGRFRLLAHGQWQAEVAGWDGNQLPWSRLRSLRSDNAGGFWISLREEGLAHVRADGSLHRITGADGLPSQLVQALFPDRDGSLWTGYHRGGLLQVRPRLLHPVARAEGLMDTLVTSVTEDSAGSIWIGTAGGSVARWRDGSCTNLILPLRGAFCQDVVVCADPAGRVWIGTGGNGLLVHEAGVFRHVIEPAALPGGVRLLFVQRNGVVWFANFSGLYRLENEKPVRVMEFKATSQVAAALAEGPNGELWVGTVAGTLRRYQQGKWQDFTPTDNVAASRFWSLLPEKDGTVWVGTMNQGLLRFKDGQFARFSKREGLADDCISQILFDGNEHLWLGTRAGILRVARNNLDHLADGGFDAANWRIFGRGDGLLTTAFTFEFQPNCVRGRDGVLWFGSANGVSWVRPANLRDRQPPPPVVIESLLVDGNVREISSVNPNATTALVPTVPKVVVGPGVKNLQIDFTAPNFISPELIRYKYRLDGLDSDWIPVRDRRITYTHLPPGKFTFHVTAGNSDGVWNAEGASFDLEVKPFFYQRSSFIVGCVVMAAGLLTYAVRTVTRRRMKRKVEKLERQRELDQERARIAQDLHDDLGAALTEISLTSDLIQDETLDKGISRGYIREIGGRARELIVAMDEIVWAVNPRNDSTASLSAYCCQYAQHHLKPSGIACRLKIDSALPSISLNTEQRHQVFLAFKEALNNVVRHSKAREMLLIISAPQDEFLIEIQDDGCGFDAGLPAEGADGLHNMPERLARIGGVCIITSRPDQGTRVTLRIPLPQINH